MNTIFSRRSIRKYTDIKVSNEHIEQILRAGMAAPSATNKQPWHFIVIDDRTLMNKITEIHPYSQMLKEASHAILTCGDLSIQSNVGYVIQDCSAAIENMLLMAQDIGLGAVWLGVYPREERINPIKELFELPENIIPTSLMAIGYPAEIKQPNHRFDKSRVHKNKW